MEIKQLIEEAAMKVGGQRALAERLQESEQHVSNWKNGLRPCGPKKKAAIAAVAGYNPTRVLIESFADELSEDDATQKGAKEALLTLLAAFPPETDKISNKKKHTWLLARLFYQLTKYRHTPTARLPRYQPLGC